MFLFLLEVLKNFADIRIPQVFDYYSTRMALGAITSLCMTIFFGKHFIKKLYEWKIGDRVRSEDCPLLGELHRNKKDTPTMGGILILFSMLISLFFWMDLKNSFTLILLVTTLSIGFIGAWDDYLKLRYKNKKGLSPRKKLILQMIVSFSISSYLLWSPITESIHYGSWFAPPHAKESTEKSTTLVFNTLLKAEDKSDLTLLKKINESGLATLTTKEYSARLYLPFFKDPIAQFSGWSLIGMAIFFTFVITGSSNAVNLTDGLDGLATGTVLLAATAFALIAFISNHLDLSKYLNILYVEGSGEIAIYLSATIGACLGFLWYNGHPAQVFMGDTGSLTLGAILGVTSVLLKRELLLGIIGGVFVIEAISVILQVMSYKLRNKKRIFLCAPIHHHFEYKGWPETKVVLRFWIIGLMLAIIGISTLKFQ